MELLVHIAAPTSKKDDDRYKAQFLSYLEFEPVRVNLPSEDVQQRTSKTPVVPQTSPSAYAQNLPGSVERKSAWKTPFQRLEDVRIYRTLTSSAGRTAKRVRLTPEFSPRNESFHTISTIRSSEEPNSVSRIPATGPTKTLTTPSPAAPSSLLPDTYGLSPSSSSGNQSLLPDIEAERANDQFVSTRSDHRGSNVGNAPFGSGSRVQKQTVEIGSQVLEIHNGVLLNVRPVHPGPSVLQKVSSREARVSATPLKDPASNPLRTDPAPTKPLPNSSATMTEPTSSQLQELSSLPKQIRGPPPEVDSLHWNANKSHVTKDLRNLGPIIEPAKRYKPVSQGRKLDAWERGYWFVDTESWPVGTQLNFWNMLGKTIKRGSAGYATWCEMSGKRSPDGSLLGLGEVKVWCWGDEVMHMYLLLYTTSLRKIAKVGAQWRSWNGEVIVQMKDERTK